MVKSQAEFHNLTQLALLIFAAGNLFAVIGIVGTMIAWLCGWKPPRFFG